MFCSNVVVMFRGYIVKCRVCSDFESVDSSVKVSNGGRGISYWCVICDRYFCVVV